jgi:hypothetical protein
MTTAVDSVSQACAKCGRVVPPHALVYDGSARLICTSCEADAEATAIGKSNALRLAFGPPAIALLGTFTFCLPFLNIFLPLVFGALALFGGVSAIRTAIGGAGNEGVTSTTQPLLLVSGIIAALWGLGLAGLNLLAWLGLALR